MSNKKQPVNIVQIDIATWTSHVIPHYAHLRLFALDSEGRLWARDESTEALCVEHSRNQGDWFELTRPEAEQPLMLSDAIPCKCAECEKRRREIEAHERKTPPKPKPPHDQTFPPG